MLITFYLLIGDRDLTATRDMEACPRVGDHVQIDRGVYEVTQVMWTPDAGGGAFVTAEDA